MTANVIPSHFASLVMAIVAALCFTTGGVAMKQADGIANLPATASFILLFAVGAVLQSLLMRGSELGATYILILGIEAALAFGFGIWLYDESIAVVKTAGLGLIVAGIALLRVA
jgi:multidrug transporter EmrE-like cation transporter